MSSVVGVALLIAITVILAAVIGFVVLDTSASTTDTSNARLDFANTTNGITVSHEGGDTFNGSNVIVRVNGATQGTLSEAPYNVTTFNTGNTFEVNAGSGDTITIVWDDPQSDREVQIASKTVE